MQALSNRYPAAQRGKPVIQSRPRPLPKPYPKPDNDNLPGSRKPRPLPDNDNRPGRPKRIPRGSIAARWLLRRSVYGLSAMVVGTLIKEYLSEWFYTNLAGAALSDWQLDFKCKTGNAQWGNGNNNSCLTRQTGLAAGLYPSVAHYMQATFYSATHLNQWFGPYPHPLAPSIPAWDLAANYSRAINNQSQPEIDDFPWPEYLPLPDPDVWPVGLPYPKVAPAVRPVAVPGAGGKNTRDSSSPGTRYKKETAFDPFPRRPGKGEKERKIKGQGLLKILGRGLSGYSEVGDFIESIWDALPEQYRTTAKRAGEARWRGRNVHLADKVMDLYEHIDKVDMGQAVRNLIINEIGDQIVGRLIGRATKTFGNNLGNALVTGLGRG